MMTKKQTARIISEISNGFLTMILTPVLAISFSTLEPFIKLLLSTSYLLVTIIPYFVLKAMGKVSDYEFTNRKERPPYFITISLLFGLLHLISTTLGEPTVTTISLNLFVVSSIITLITLFWKISGHMTYSTLLFTTLLFIFPQHPVILLLFVLTPFIGWSRIVLEKHTLSQVTLGTLLTLSISILFYWGFC